MDISNYSESVLKKLTDELQHKKVSLLDESRPEAIKKQHKAGKLTARERIEYLLDKETFIELGMLVQHKQMEEAIQVETPADGVIVGTGEVEGRTVVIAASDYTVLGGSIGYSGMKKLERIVKIAKDSGVPVILLIEGGGHRIQEGLDSKEVAKFASLSLFIEISILSGWVPLVCAIMGPGFAGPSNLSSLCDFVPIVKNGTMGIAGPKLVKAAIGEDISIEEVGSAAFHTTKTGMADLLVENDKECLDEIKKFLSYVPSSANNQPPKIDCKDQMNTRNESLLNLLPDSPSKVYDIREILNLTVDNNTLYELKPNFAKNIVTAFARINGHSVGIVANQTLYLGGVLDAAACTKAARFISFCDAFHIPIISFVDLPGFLPGSQSEKAGLIRKAGKLQYEMARVTVPRITVVIRKAYGFAYMVMAAGSDYIIAWPTAEICAMSIEGAVDVAFHSEYEKADNPSQQREKIIMRFKQQTGAMYASEGFGIDDVIDPLKTKYVIAKMLERLPYKINKSMPPKKHGISPI